MDTMNNEFYNNFLTRDFKYPSVFLPIHRGGIMIPNNSDFKPIGRDVNINFKKTFVLDTNILINDPNSIFNFEKNLVVIPLIVIEELDHLKKKSIEARTASRILGDIMTDYDSINPGEIFDIDDKKYKTISFDLPNDGKLMFVETESFNLKNTPDDIIINVAEMLMGSILVSNDNNVRIKAIIKGINAQKYTSDMVVEDTDYICPGYHLLPDGWLESIPNTELKTSGEGFIRFDKKYLPETINSNKRIMLRQWVINDNDGIIGKVKEFIEDDIIIQLFNIDQMKKRRCAGVTPMDSLQAAVIHDILDKDIDIITILGPAGSGKTLLAVASSCEIIYGKKGSHIDSVIFSRTPDSQFDDIGFLPGDETEKMAPWMGGLTDNLEFIAKLSKHDEFLPANSIFGSDPFIKIKAMNFLRGRSIMNKIVIIDEAQNMTHVQMKTAISRIGEGSKIILLGNLSQIDNKYISAQNSGLTHVTHKFKEYEFGSTIILNGGKRSRLATFAEENM